MTSLRASIVTVTAVAACLLLAGCSQHPAGSRAASVTPLPTVSSNATPAASATSSPPTAPATADTPAPGSTASASIAPTVHPAPPAAAAGSHVPSCAQLGDVLTTAGVRSTSTSDVTAAREAVVKQGNAPWTVVRWCEFVVPDTPTVTANGTSVRPQMEVDIVDTGANGALWLSLAGTHRVALPADGGYGQNAYHITEGSGAGSVVGFVGSLAVTVQDAPGLTAAERVLHGVVAQLS